MIKKNNILGKKIYYGEKPKEIYKREEKIFSALKIKIKRLSELDILTPKKNENKRIRVFFFK